MYAHGQLCQKLPTSFPKWLFHFAFSSINMNAPFCFIIKWYWVPEWKNTTERHWNDERQNSLSLTTPERLPPGAEWQEPGETYTWRWPAGFGWPDVQAGLRKGRGTRDQIANICWILQKAREFQSSIYFCFIDYTKAFAWTMTNCGKLLKCWEYQATWPASWEVCMQVKKR